MGALRNLLGLLSLPLHLSKVLLRMDGEAKKALRKSLSTIDPGALKAVLGLLDELGPDLTAKLLGNYLIFSAAMHEKLSTFLKPGDFQKLKLGEDLKRGLQGLAVSNPEFTRAFGSFLGLVLGRTLKGMMESEEFRRNLAELLKNLGLLWEETYRLPRG
ncbi:MAG: hypothetical protein QXH26_00420 [Candidatus Hadarchaeales archaeon]